MCKKKGRDPVFRCIYCGKYIAYADIGTDKIKEQFTPETEITTEEQLFWHLECERKDMYEYKNCEHEEQCKKEWGEEYKAIIGTHHCRFSWNKFIKPI